jgi:hypothetical protein
MAFPSRSNYETLVYSAQENNPQHIVSSTLKLYSVSAFTATVQGEILFSNGLTLRIREFLDFKQERIVDYSYTIYRGDQKIRWYDPQPHPENKKLAATFPHHFHEEPDPSTGSGQSIKHNRKPAEGISFEAPNLPVLIKICIGLG